MFHYHSTVQDMTTSLVFADRGSMHVVEHQDDIFSWKKYNSYTCMSTTEMCRMLFERSNKLFGQKYNVLNLLTEDSLVSRLE
jgi:hypothetical protein